MFKNFVQSAATIFIAAAVSVSSCFGADDGLRFGLELRPAEFQFFPKYLQQISNVPASARTVSIHAGDPGAGSPVLIPVASVQPGSYFPFNLSIAPEIGYGRITVRAGLIFAPVSFAPTAKLGSFGSTQEYNYIQGGTSRGYGAALVYYAGLVQPAKTPGAFGELEVRVGAGLSGILGYQRSQHNVEIQQGWDRYDALEKYQTLQLSSDVLQQAYAGIRWTKGSEWKFKPSVFVYGGPALVGTDPTSLGKTAVLTYRHNPFFVGSGVAFQWDWHSKR